MYLNKSDDQQNCSLLQKSYGWSFSWHYSVAMRVLACWDSALRRRSRLTMWSRTWIVVPLDLSRFRTSGFQIRGAPHWIPSCTNSSQTPRGFTDPKLGLPLRWDRFLIHDCDKYLNAARKLIQHSTFPALVYACSALFHNENVTQV